jgi:cobalt-zinc-cadmium efflux system membrane fusion protein
VSHARRLIGGLLCLTLLAAGCTRRAEVEGANEPTPAASADVAPDMCAEHGVLEAICTKCHPKLIPVFQAKGDWCAEHGFAMSVCPVHHPERGGRPAVAVAVDEAPASGTLVRFRTPQAETDAGIETYPATSGSTAAGIHATATLVADAAHMALVNPRAAGVVHTIHADVGSRVARGAPLAVLESSVVGEERARLQAARVRAEVAEANHRREKELFERGLNAQRDVQEAEREATAARAELAAVESSLGMLEVTDGAAGAYVMRAPIAGTVTRRTATVGTLVDTHEPLFEIVDTARLWADIDVPELHLSRVRRGQTVVLTADGLPGREFRGTVTFVSPAIDPQTRTVKARALLANPHGALRANMFAKARILDDATRSAVLVPREAVQDARGVQVLFVQLEAGTYETRRVHTLPAEGGMLAVLADVKAGERVVTTGSFLLKTETLKESIGAGCCEIEPARKR